MMLVDKHGKVKVIKKWKRLLTQKMARSLLGQLLPPLYSKNSKVVKTLSDMLKKWLFQQWDELCHQTFGKLESKLFFRRLCSSSRNVINFLKCKGGRVILPLAEY